MTSLINYLLYFTRLPNSSVEGPRIFKLRLKLFKFSVGVIGVPLKNSSVISNFIIIKEIKHWKNRAIHISIPKASVV